MTATASITFDYPEVSVHLSSCEGVTPQMLHRAEKLLHKEFLQQRGQMIHAVQQRERKKAKEAEKEREKTEKEFHKKEDERLQKAAGEAPDVLIKRLQEENAMLKDGQTKAAK